MLRVCLPEEFEAGVEEEYGSVPVIALPHVIVPRSGSPRPPVEAKLPAVPYKLVQRSILRSDSLKIESLDSKINV